MSKTHAYIRDDDSQEKVVAHVYDCLRYQNVTKIQDSIYCCITFVVV